MKFIQVNARDLSNLQGLDISTTLGVEVTLPAAAALCSMGNLDHHGANDTVDTPSACMQALEMVDGINFCTPANVLYVGMDADTLTACALLFAASYSGHDTSSVRRDTVTAIDMIDRNGRHACPDQLGMYGVKEMYALIHAAGRITTTEQARDLVVKASVVLMGGADQYTKEVADHSAFLTGVADRAKVTIAKLADGRPVALVQSPDFTAVQHGYQFADVVIATNPQMRSADGSTYLKRTIAVRDSNVGIDLKKVYPALNSLQPGWGGHSLIGGSPIDVDCAVGIDQIISALFTCA